MTDFNEEEDPAAFLAVTLLLSGLRSSYILSQALAKKFPTEAAWQEFLASPVYKEMVTEFATCVDDVRSMSELSPIWSPQEVQDHVASHYPRALDAVQEFAELVEVAGEDVLAVLITA